MRFVKLEGPGGAFFVDPDRIDTVSEAEPVRVRGGDDIVVRNITVRGATFRILNIMINFKAIGFTVDDV